jgi:transmembrane sensor
MITEDILVKYLAGETEPHEVAMIQQWRKASPENEKHFRQLETLWTGSGGLKNSQAVDVEAAWNKVERRMEVTPKGRVASMNTRWLVAASLALFMGLGIFFISRNRGMQGEMLSVSTTAESRNVQLSDGSRLIVKNGQVSYPRTFDGSKRKVKLSSGKVYFDIASDKEKPFEIEANNTVITVLGTEFEVVSYADYTQVMVKEGKVRFNTPDGEAMLTAGMAAKYDRKVNRLEHIQQRGRNTFAYASGRLVFENDRLASVVSDLNLYYNSEVIMENPQIGNCIITSSFEKEKLENVLAVIAGTLNLEIEHLPNSNKIILRGRGCTP